MGLRHDWYVDAGFTPFTYAHGYVSLAGRFRTVMAYADACSSQGFPCTRLLAFSNPDLTYQGHPMGVPGGTSITCTTGNVQNMGCDADERRALNETAIVVANFREFSTLRPPLIRTHPQSQSVVRGQTLTLEVAAEGLGPFTYQWYRGASPGLTQPIAGATGPVFTFAPGADGIWLERWSYWVRVTNEIGGANSGTAIVTMAVPGADAAAPARRGLGHEATGARRGGGRAAVAVPRTRAGAATASLWFRWPVKDVDRPVACRVAEIEATLAWARLAQRSEDAPEIVAVLDRLAQAHALLNHPACQVAHGRLP
jgi:hypothetical protein